MTRTLLAVLVVALSACSSGGGSGTTSRSSGGPSGATGSTGAGTSGPGTSASTGTGAGTAGTGASSSTGGGITGDNFDQAVNTADCQLILECEGAAPYLSTICGSLTQLFRLQDLPMAIDAGRVTLNAEKVSSCLADLMSGDCNEMKLAAVACGEAITGEVAPAGLCYSGTDCQSGGCSGNDAGTCSPGVCQGLAEMGESCGCPTCGACDPAEALVCFNGICTRPASPEESCGENDPPCEPALACVAGTCVTLPIPSGHACTFGVGQCQSGSYCFQTISSLTGSCTSQVALGDPCDEDPNHSENAFSFVDNECAGAHVVCAGAGTLLDGGTAAGICQTLADIGASCTAPGPDLEASADYNDGCYAGLDCVDGGCTRAPSSGPCATGAYPCDVTATFCASATKTCQNYIPVGGPCDEGDRLPCGFDAICQDDVCQSTQGCSPSL
jgi:hypothetical protein